MVASDEGSRRQVGALGRHQPVGTRGEPVHRAPVEGEKAQGVRDAHGVLGRGHALPDDVDHDQVQGAVGQHDPVVEVSPGGSARVGGQVVHAELGRLDLGDDRTHGLLQLVDDLALRGFQLGQAVHRAQVLESCAQMGGEAGDGGLGPLVEAIGRRVPEQQRPVRAAVG